MIDRRKMLAVSGAALAAGAFGCSPESGTQQATQTPETPQPVPPAPDPTPAPGDLSMDEVIQEFLAESLSERDRPASTDPNDLVVSFAELEKNPELVAGLKEVTAGVINGDPAYAAKPVTDLESPDYHSFAMQTEFGADAKKSDATFDLTGEVLKSIARSSGYLVTIERDATVLFGLRGCTIAQGSRTGQTIKVKEADINHKDRLCLIGTWKPATGDIAVYEGSTVPNIVNMQMHLFYNWSKATSLKNIPQVALLMSGQMPTGLHTYEVGTHRLSAKKVEDRYPGSLRQVSASPVLRAQTDLHYKVTDGWDPLLAKNTEARNANDVRVTNCNIHAGINKNHPKFASQGCQTIEGALKPKGIQPTGQWQEFTSGLGIQVIPDGPNFKSTADGKRYRYMLATGREARLHAQSAGKPDMLKRLQRVKIGTVGPTAAALRKAIGSPDGSTVDGKIMNDWLRFQQRLGIPLDGVVTPRLAEDQKLKIFT